MTEYVVTNHREGYQEVFYNLSAAKKAMKEHNATGEKIKVWSNGDWEPMGPIVLKGSNKAFIANSPRGMKKANY